MPDWCEAISEPLPVGNAAMNCTLLTACGNARCCYLRKPLQRGADRRPRSR